MRSEITEREKAEDPAIERMAAVFNEWMRRCTESPEEFRREWETIVEYLGDQADGKTPSYGVRCSRYFRSIAHELFGDCPPITEEP